MTHIFFGMGLDMLTAHQVMIKSVYRRYSQKLCAMSKLNSLPVRPRFWSGWTQWIEGSNQPWGATPNGHGHAWPIFKMFEDVQQKCGLGICQNSLQVVVFCHVVPRAWFQAFPPKKVCGCFIDIDLPFLMAMPVIHHRFNACVSSRSHRSHLVQLSE